MKNHITLVLGVFFLLAQDGFAQEWKEYKGQHFIIYYESAPMDFVKTLHQNAENYYNEITSNLDFTRYHYWQEDDRAQVYIYDNAEDYFTEARQAHWSSGSAQTRSKVIRTFPTAHGFFDSTLPHELGHIIFREFIGDDVQVPLWFEEGVAMYQEKAKRWGAHDHVRQAITDNAFMPLKELSSFYLSEQTEQKKVELFYAESASIVYYLIQEQGKTRFVRLCRKLQENILFEEAFKEVYFRFKNIDDLNKAWKDYIEK